MKLNVHTTLCRVTTWPRQKASDTTSGFRFRTASDTAGEGGSGATGQRTTAGEIKKKTHHQKGKPFAAQIRIHALYPRDKSYLCLHSPNKLSPPRLVTLFQTTDLVRFTSSYRFCTAAGVAAAVAAVPGGRTTAWRVRGSTSTPRARATRGTSGPTTATATGGVSGVIGTTPRSGTAFETPN